MSVKNVVIIGAGASGLLCAGTASSTDCQVTVLEKNEKPARKVMITGKGRCNVTNDCSVDTLISSTVSNGRFLYSAFNTFDSQDLMKLLEKNGVKLKTERGNRVFPVSDKSADIVDALKRYALSSGAKILTSTTVKDIIIDNESVIGVELENGNIINCDAVVVATGGLSYPATGSTGDGYKFAEKAHHTVVKLEPSLVPLECKEVFCSELMGLSLKNIKLSVCDTSKKNKKIFETFGEMVFTHFGISGPIVLSASTHLRPMEEERYTIHIDLKPALTKEDLDKRLLKDFNQNLNKNFKNSLSNLLPKKIIPVIIKMSGIDPDEKVNLITKEMRQKLCNLLKDFSVTVTGFRPIDEAVVTAGGVKVSEIDPKTMMSKKVNNLYFIGEILDIDSYTGGFNLQNAFSTGYLAGVDLKSRELIK